MAIKVKQLIKLLLDLPMDASVVITRNEEKCLFNIKSVKASNDYCEINYEDFEDSKLNVVLCDIKRNIKDKIDKEYIPYTGGYKRWDQRWELKPDDVSKIIDNYHLNTKSPTNGDVVKSLFPNLLYDEYCCYGGIKKVRLIPQDKVGKSIDISGEWWDSPYYGGIINEKDEIGN